MIEELQFNFWCVVFISGFYALLAAFMREKMPNPRYFRLARLLGLTSFLLLAAFGWHAIHEFERYKESHSHRHESTGQVGSGIQYQQASIKVR